MAGKSWNSKKKKQKLSDINLPGYDNGLYLYTTQEHLQLEMALQVVCRHHGADSGKYKENGNKYDQGQKFAEGTSSVCSIFPACTK